MKAKPELDVCVRKPFRIAIVTALFNADVTRPLRQETLARLHDVGIPEDSIISLDVPGAVEIPVTVKKLAASGLAEVIIALGAVIRGETTHYDYVCEQVSQGCQQVALAHQIPVIFGILTTESIEQALARVCKGRDLADSAVHMKHIFDCIERL